MASWPGVVCCLVTLRQMKQIKGQIKVASWVKLELGSCLTGAIHMKSKDIVSMQLKEAIKG